MNIIFYILIFIIGILFGSFYTLAVYRIPKRQDITHTHSYCPNCNHKLGFLDLIPIFSYIFLGAKCRYCKEKIRPRYFVLEMLSGILFVAIAYVMNFNFETINALKIIEYSFIVLYVTFIVLICGIDKENKKMDKSVNCYGIVISIMYMLYLCIVDNSSIYRYGIYLVLYIIVLIFDTITLRKYAKNNYLTGILLMILTMAVFTSEYIIWLTINITLIAIAIYLMIYKIKNIKKRYKKTDKQVTKKINIGLYLGISNILTFLVIMAYINYLR